jgi:lysozyme
MVPPDINTQVLVMFINGDPARGIWIGAMYNQFMNNMVPGMASSDNTYQYPGRQVPAAEYNKWDKSVVSPDNAKMPFESTKFMGVGNQGLINDQARGVTSASARRESPSNVFGILTPGPIIEGTDKNASGIRRKGGSSFIMDDGPGTENVTLTTKSGAQIKLDETNGFVYLINRDGTAWVQMDQQGNIEIFGATNISMRAQKDVNIRADRNINIEAGQNIFMKAAKDTVESTTTFTYDVNNVPRPTTIPYWQYVGEGNGAGGNIVTQALNNTHTTVKNTAFITVDKNLELKVSGNINISATSDFNLTAPNIKNAGDVEIRGTLDVAGRTGLGAALAVAGSLQAGEIRGAFPGVAGGGGVVTGSPGPSVSVGAAPNITSAEVKQLTQKINILATWTNSESRFQRNSQSLLTTLSRLATYEPCPEHEKFSFNSVSGYSPTKTQGQDTYEGSGSAGNTPTIPVANTDPGANNTDLPPALASDSALSKDFNMRAYQCQLKIHEGVKYVSYLDTVGLPTAGIGHLLRTDEIVRFPVPTPVSEAQVTAWFEQDAQISIAGAQRTLGVEVWGNLTDTRKRACADLCFNLGQPRLSRFVRFIAAMKVGDYNAAGESLRNSKWFTQVGRRGPSIIAMVVQNIDPTLCDRKFPG